ncbi:hypothetical protein [Flavobacterium cyanobacteriorum]|uniref:hypothetical protein n=1 Tax=Flavobacterium cyanobacteriorum TaxID=2022802 RepID=UPI0013FE078E|nr:hypothetical protein [Flavobacterium cyanobacteriorum]
MGSISCPWQTVWLNKDAEAVKASCGGPETTVICTLTILHAFWPGLGVKTYVAVAVLLTTLGDQVPAIPFSEVVGSTGAAVFAQNLVTILKAGSKQSTTETNI